MRSSVLLLLPFAVVSTLAQQDSFSFPSPSSTIIWNPPKRGLLEDPYRCQNGGDLMCCDYISGRTNPCHNSRAASVPSECRYYACCMTKGRGYYCLDPPAGSVNPAPYPPETLSTVPVPVPPTSSPAPSPPTPATDSPAPYPPFPPFSSTDSPAPYSPFGTDSPVPYPPQETDRLPKYSPAPPAVP